MSESPGLRMLRAMQEGLPDAEARQIFSEEQLAIALNRLLRVPPNHYKEGRDVQGVLQASDAALRAEVTRLRAAATEALAVLARLADSAHQWAGRGVPAGLIAEIDDAKARLAGALACEARP